MGCWLVWFVQPTKEWGEKCGGHLTMAGALGKQPKTKAYLLKARGPAKYFVAQPSWTPELEQSPRIKQQSLKDQSVPGDLLWASRPLSDPVQCMGWFEQNRPISVIQCLTALWSTMRSMLWCHIFLNLMPFLSLVLFCHLHSYFIVSQWIFVSCLVFVHYKL